ncbi:MAG TPA: tRNA dihydrouridine synthase DusB [Soehngenia sp.]|nr:tRNA dihydrouridine synthase DusB [Soehngenia sp.]HPP32163.1 tRNA dihydrouridine synthase DusB [Soehngenia sp.]
MGNVNIKSKAVLAPMAGYTDLTFRKIAKRLGAGLVTSEMVSAKGMYYNDKKTFELTMTDETERPFAIQIFGSDPDIMAYVVETKLNTRDDFDIVDINMGCPAPKIVKNNEGSALMNDLKLSYNIVKKIVDTSNKPVTVKIRMGWDKDNINGVDFAKMLEQAGASAVTVHARTREMFYSGKADIDFIKKVKESISIPVIGNGDISKAEDAISLLERTNCDYVAVGRAAIGNPWIFLNINEALSQKEITKPTPEMIINMVVFHLNELCNIKGEKIGVKEMRKHIHGYIKGLPNSKNVRDQINTINSKAEIVSVLYDYLDKLKSYDK